MGYHLSADLDMTIRPFKDQLQRRMLPLPTYDQAGCAYVAKSDVVREWMKAYSLILDRMVNGDLFSGEDMAFFVMMKIIDSNISHWMYEHNYEIQSPDGGLVDDFVNGVPSAYEAVWF